MFNEATFREILLPSSGDDGRSISRNVASLNILVHDVMLMQVQDYIDSFLNPKKDSYVENTRLMKF